ncbi:MAG: hypothetical protein HGA19_05040 [Oscillochloris sp.]|nr:hypothetical protein [Oscillochloris sp.]
MNKYPAYARSRTAGRDERHDIVRRSSNIAAARQVAAHFVAAHWPALASVAPEVMLVYNRPRPSPEIIARLGLDAAELPPASLTPTYTFTFASQRRTTDGVVTPLVATVMVDSQRRIVKTSLSK